MRRSAFTRVRARAAVACALLAAVAMSGGAFEPAARGASSNVTVTFGVASMTSISLGGCPVAARTLGTVLPGVPTVTGADCTVQFGSSNDTSRLRLLQSDHSNTAMFAWTVGTKDAGFNAAPAGGKQLVPPGGGDGADAFWRGGGLLDVAVDGDVLKGGDVANTFTIGRWSPSGALRTATWGGGDGYASVDTAVDDAAITGGHWPGQLLALRSGRVAIAGVVNAPTDKVAIARFDTAGIIDATFGSGDGVLTFTIPTSNNPESTTLTELPDGSLLVAGTTDLDAYFVAKVTPAGVLDTGFGGGDGVWTRAAGGGDALGGSVVQLDDGRFMYAASIDMQPFVARLTADGALDTTYAGVGWSTPSTGTANGSQGGAFLDTTGNLYIVGNSSGCTHVAITRLTPTGAADTAWAAGDATITHTTIGTGYECADFGATVQMGDGRFCTGGDHLTGTARYWIGCFRPDGSFDPTFGTAGFVEFTGQTGVESAAGGIAAANGRIYAGGGNGNFTILALGSDAQTIPDYVNPGTNFASAGGAFGACLRTSANATPTWPTAPANDCSADGAHWKGVAKLGVDPTAEIATAAATVTTATASLRFGAKVGTGIKGSFVAPLTFEVLAP